MKRAAFWLSVLRLPALLVAAYVGRHGILDAIERVDGLGNVTAIAIDRFSTPVTRLIAAGLFVVLVWAARYVGRRHPFGSYLASVGLAAALSIAAAIWLDAWHVSAAVGALAVATNLAPDSPLRASTLDSRGWSRFMAWGIGLAELFFSHRYLQWITGRRIGRAGAIPGMLFAASVMAAGLDGRALTPLEQRLRSGPAVRVIATGDFNWIELDTTGRYLFVTGHGLDRLRRYDLQAAPPTFLESAVDTGRAQAFAYDPIAAEVFVYKSSAEQLLYLDAETLRLKRSASIRGVAGGDKWLAADGPTGTILVTSERDTPGVPLVTIDRTSGSITDQRDLDSGNLLKHPFRPYAYLSTFRGASRLSLYDLAERRVRAETTAATRSHRMAYWQSKNEVLLAASTEARIQRFDADTLAAKGSFAAPFGVRAMAVDELRQLMLCASSTAGTITRIDLVSGRAIGRQYLGPWLRSIALRPSQGRAWVSSNGALYELDYGSGASAR